MSVCLLLLSSIFASSMASHPSEMELKLKRTVETMIPKPHLRKILSLSELVKVLQKIFALVEKEREEEAAAAKRKEHRFLI